MHTRDHEPTVRCPYEVADSMSLTSPSGGPVMEPIGGVLGWAARSPTFEAFRFREFRLLWLGQLGSAMGQWMDQVTRGWLMYDLTGSALQLGLISALRFFPILLLSPLAGTV